MTRLTKSQPVALLGEALPRVLVEPTGAKANSWEDVADLSARAGIVLDGWQELILKAAMGERRDNTWAAKRVGVTVPRQNGKSQLLVARALAGAVLFGEKKIVISAHQQDTAREAFNKLVEILEADGNGWLMDRVRPRGIMNAINREQVKFVNGATIQFKARSGAAGKGFSSDCLMLDEAQILSQRAWVSINSTMSAMHNPQVWLLGTSPQEEDDSEVFESIRAAAIDGRSSAAAWCEWGNDPTTPDYLEAKDDLAAKRWTPAVELLCWSGNPAWNTRVNHEVVAGELETYSEDKFAQDRLGVWLSDFGGGSRAVSAELWEDTAVDEGPADGVQSYAVAFSLDGEHVSLGGARKHDEGVHIAVIDALGQELDLGQGLTRLADWFCEGIDGKPRWRRSAGIALSGRAGAPALAQLLRDRGVPERWLFLPSTPKYVEACSMWLDGLRSGTVTHRREGQGVLDASVAVVDLDKRGGLASTAGGGDETPVESVALAHWVARVSPLNRRRESSERKAKFL